MSRWSGVSILVGSKWSYNNLLYITYKEEDSVVTLTYIYLFQECTDIDLVETELTMI